MSRDPRGWGVMEREPQSLRGEKAGKGALHGGVASGVTPPEDARNRRGTRRQNGSWMVTAPGAGCEGQPSVGDRWPGCGTRGRFACGNGGLGGRARAEPRDTQLTTQHEGSGVSGSSALCWGWGLLSTANWVLFHRSGHFWKRVCRSPQLSQILILQ